MPRSDGWTIHMRHPLIKRTASVAPRRTTCRQCCPSWSPTLCLASLIQAGETLGALMTVALTGSVVGRFFSGTVTRGSPACGTKAIMSRDKRLKYSLN